MKTNAPLMTIIGRLCVYFGMLAVCIASWFAVFWVGMRIANAGSSDCAFIKDADQRNYCRATTTKKPSYCAFIKDSDLRNRCRAETKK